MLPAPLGEPPAAASSAAAAAAADVFPPSGDDTPLTPLGEKWNPLPLAARSAAAVVGSRLASSCAS